MSAPLHIYTLGCKELIPPTNSLLEYHDHNEIIIKLIQAYFISLSLLPFLYSFELPPENKHNPICTVQFTWETLNEGSGRENI